MILQRLFGYNPEATGSTFADGIKVEVMAGITTFLAMACILALNPAILASTGMDKGGVFTATAISAAVATLVMSIYGKLPLWQMPSAPPSALCSAPPP